MDALRQKWLDLVTTWRLHPEAPANDRHWAPELETCSRERLKEIQNEKLEVLVPYMGGSEVLAPAEGVKGKSVVPALVHVDKGPHHRVCH